MGATLSLGLLCKYTFVAMIPVLGVILLQASRSHHWAWARSARTLALAIAIPAVLMISILVTEHRNKSFLTDSQWLPRGTPGEMDFKDVLLPKANDLGLLDAPVYYDRKFLVPHKYSYWGLIHYGVFTDIFNAFQPLKFDLATHQGDVGTYDKVRSRDRQLLMKAAVILGLIWSFAAVAGTTWVFFSIVRDWREKKPWDRLKILVLLGTSTYFLFLFSLPYLDHSVMWGSFTPRLIMSAPFAWYFSGFVFLDRSVTARASFTSWIIFGLVLAQSALHVSFLY